jgi:hypothetical protein
VGGIERAVALLGGDAGTPPWTPGRAGRRIAALAELLARYPTGSQPAA